MLGLKPFDPDQVGPILRYMAAAERAWNRALTQLRITQNDRRKREMADPAPPHPPQPEQTEKVMAVGSVPQNDPEPVAPAAVPAEAPTQTEPVAVEVRLVPENISAAANPVGQNANPRRGRLDMVAIMQKLEEDIRITEEQLRQEENGSGRR
jgi:hypothetical protein